jgi:hypothetical protein
VRELQITSDLEYANAKCIDLQQDMTKEIADAKYSEIRRAELQSEVDALLGSVKTTIGQDIQLAEVGQVVIELNGRVGQATAERDATNLRLEKGERDARAMDEEQQAALDKVGNCIRRPQPPQV